MQRVWKRHKLPNPYSRWRSNQIDATELISKDKYPLDFSQVLKFFSHFRRLQTEFGLASKSEKECNAGPRTGK